MTYIIANECLPIVNAVNAGIPLGMFRVGDKAPTLPHTPMMIVCDDRKGKGPLKFDIGPLLAQVDAIIFTGPDTFELAAKATVLGARADQRVLLVATKVETLGDWLEIIIGTPLLAHNFCLFGSWNMPKRVGDLINEIDKLNNGKAH